jgi:RNA polymerase sigma-70 factor, ECF subfamily
MWGIAARRLIDAVRRSPPATAYGDIGAALDKLPPDLHAVVRASVVDGLTSKEAGQLLGIPTGTVKTRMIGARMILRKDLA